MTNYYEFALQYGEWGVIKDMMSRGGKLAKQSKEENKTELMLASLENTASVVSELIRSGANLNSFDRFHRNAFFYAAMGNTPKALETLVFAGSYAKVANSNGYNPLLAAAESNGHAESIRFLIKIGFDVNEQSADQWTPLSFASLANNARIVQELIDAGADVNLNNPLIQSAYSNSIEVIRTLLAAGASKTQKNTANETAYDVAVRCKRDSQILKLLKPSHER